MALRLGELLVQQRIVTPKQLEEALKAQMIYGGRLGTNLVELGHITLDELARALGAQRQMPVATSADFDAVTPSTLELISAETAAKFVAFPLFRDGPRRIKVAMLNPYSIEDLDQLGFITGMRVVPFIAPELQIYFYLERHYGISRDARYIRLGPDPTQIAAASVPPIAPPVTANPVQNALFGSLNPGEYLSGDDEADSFDMPGRSVGTPTPAPSGVPVAPIRPEPQIASGAAAAAQSIPLSLTPAGGAPTGHFAGAQPASAPSPAASVPPAPVPVAGQHPQSPPPYAGPPATAPARSASGSFRAVRPPQQPVPAAIASHPAQPAVAPPRPSAPLHPQMTAATPRQAPPGHAQPPVAVRHPGAQLHSSAPAYAQAQPFLQARAQQGPVAPPHPGMPGYVQPVPAPPPGTPGYAQPHPVAPPRPSMPGRMQQQPAAAPPPSMPGHEQQRFAPQPPIAPPHASAGLRVQAPQAAVPPRAQVPGPVSPPNAVPPPAPRPRRVIELDNDDSGHVELASPWEFATWQGADMGTSASESETADTLELADAWEFVQWRPIEAPTKAEPEAAAPMPTPEPTALVTPVRAAVTPMVEDAAPVGPTSSTNALPPSPVSEPEQVAAAIATGNPAHHTSVGGFEPTAAPDVSTFAAQGRTAAGEPGNSAAEATSAAPLAAADATAASHADPPPSPPDASSATVGAPAQAANDPDPTT